VIRRREFITLLGGVEGVNWTKTRLFLGLQCEVPHRAVRATGLAST
jgi:hypothetical protein